MDASLTPEEHAELAGVVLSITSPRYLAWRAARALRAAGAFGGFPIPPDAPAGPLPRLPEQAHREDEAWLDVYREHGLAGLRDAPHRGRLKSLPSTSVTSVLVQPLRSSVPKVTSRSVADATGVSQSSVVRIWRHAYDPDLLSRDLARVLRSGGGVRVHGAHVSAVNCVLVLGITRSKDVRASARRSARVEPPTTTRDLRCLLQAVLSADLIRTSAHVNGGLPKFMARALALHGAEERALVLCREPLDEQGRAPVDRHPDAVLQVLNADQWQSMLPHLVDSIDKTSSDGLEQLSRTLRAWAADDTARAVEWTLDSPASPTGSPRRATAPDAGPTSGQRLAGAVTVAIQDAILAGRLRSGDRVTEAFLARTTHASRSQLRDALKALAFDGLVDLTAGPGAIVPEPTHEDVTETYAARRALGAILLQRSVLYRPDAIVPVQQALEHLKAASRTGDSWITGEADLSFQDAIADSVAMRRISTMFKRLTVQLRMFVAIMGLDYAYSVDAMVDEDSALLAAIIRRDIGQALALWEQKMTAVMQYMTRQLESRQPR